MPIKVRRLNSVIAEVEPDERITSRELQILRHEYRMELKRVNQRAGPVPLNVVLDDNQMIGRTMQDDLPGGGRTV